MIRGIFFILFIGLISTANAHSPKKITLNADSKNHSLKITVAHSVKDSESHFISKVTVLLNGQEIEALTYTKQTSASAEIILLTIDEMKEGDKIEVTAECNKAGKKKASLEVKNHYQQSK